MSLELDEFREMLQDTFLERSMMREKDYTNYTKEVRISITNLNTAIEQVGDAKLRAILTDLFRQYQDNEANRCAFQTNFAYKIGCRVGSAYKEIIKY